MAMKVIFATIALLATDSQIDGAQDQHLYKFCLIVGFLRKDMAVGMLIPLGLTAKQLIIASVVLAMYFPCVATFTTLVKELGVVDMLKSAGIMLIFSLVVGGLLNLVLT